MSIIRSDFYVQLMLRKGEAVNLTVTLAANSVCCAVTFLAAEEKAWTKYENALWTVAVVGVIYVRSRLVSFPLYFLIVVFLCFTAIQASKEHEMDEGFADVIEKGWLIKEGANDDSRRKRQVTNP